ncbi:MAG TPA: insulinase family protein, partial [Methylomirabilota bacterium]|nr:insulinase family protein [Methylomirabilota bacterium]
MNRIGLVLASALLAMALAPSAQAQEPLISRQVLPNGLTVLVREDAAAGVVAISLQVRAGSRFES